MLVVPHLARLSRLCRGRPRPCSRRLPATGAVFVFWSKYPKRPFVRIGAWQSRSMYAIHKSGVAGTSLSLLAQGLWFESRMAASSLYCKFSSLFVGACIFFTSVDICSVMIEVSSEQSRSHFYTHTEYCSHCCCRCSACWYTPVSWCCSSSRAG